MNRSQIFDEKCQILFCQIILILYIKSIKTLKATERDRIISTDYKIFIIFNFYKDLIKNYDIEYR